jgi:hypothetical protein
VNFWCPWSLNRRGPLRIAVACPNPLPTYRIDGKAIAVHSGRSVLSAVDGKGTD